MHATVELTQGPLDGLRLELKKGATVIVSEPGEVEAIELFGARSFIERKIPRQKTYYVVSGNFTQDGVRRYVWRPSECK